MSPILGSIGGISEYNFRGNSEDNPDDIILDNVLNLEPGTVGIATTTVTGLNYQALVTATNGAEFSVNAGSYTTLPKSIRNNQTLSVKFTTTSGSDSDFLKFYNTIVSVGKKKAFWSVVTRAKDTTPTSFAFTNSTNQNVGIATTSNSVTIVGLESVPATFAFISSGIGSFRLNGTPGFTTSQVSNGDTIEIVGITPDTYSSSKSIEITVGTFKTTFSITTRDADKTVNSFSFTPIVDANIGVSHTSNTITISGADNNVALASTISDSSGEVSINGQDYTSGTLDIFNGNSISLRIPSTAVVSYGTTFTTTLNVAGVAGTFSVTTRAKPIISYPNQFTFTDVNSVEPETPIESNIITLTGITEGTFGVASISGSNAEFKVIRNNTTVRNYGITTAAVTLNDQIQLRLTSGKILQTTQTLFTVSGQNTTTLPGFESAVSDSWSVTTRDVVCSPLSEGNFFVSGRFANVESAEIDTFYNTLIDFSGYDSRCNFYVSTSNPDSYIENPYTGEIGQIVAVPAIPSAGIRVWMKSSNLSNTFKSTTLSIYSLKNPSLILTKTWSIITKQLDTIPEEFNLITREFYNIKPFSVVSTFVTESLSGLSTNITVPASVVNSSGIGQVSISKNNGPFVTTISGGVKNGDRIDIKGTAGSFGSTLIAKVKVGDRTESWSVATLPLLSKFDLKITANENVYQTDRDGVLSSNVELISRETTELGIANEVVRITKRLPYNIPILLSWIYTSGGGRTWPTANLTLPYLNGVKSVTVPATDYQTEYYTGIGQYTYTYSGGLPTNADGSTDVEFIFTTINSSSQVATKKILATFDAPKPIINFTVSPSGVIPYNSSYRVDWASSNATEVVSSTNLGNTSAFNGSFVVGYARTDTTHSLTLKNATGTTTATITPSVSACSVKTIQDTYAIYKLGKIIYENNVEDSTYRYYLSTIKTFGDGNLIVDYPNKTRYSSFTYKKILYTIYSAYTTTLGRYPTNEDVSYWIDYYQRGIYDSVVFKVYNPAAPYGTKTNTAILKTQTLGLGTLLGGFTGAVNVPTITLPSLKPSAITQTIDKSITKTQNVVIGCNYYVSVSNSTGLCSLFASTDGKTLSAQDGSATTPYDYIINANQVTEDPNFEITSPTFRFSKITAVRGSDAGTVGSYSGTTGNGAKYSNINLYVSPVQEAYRFGAINNTGYVELSVTSTWANSSGFVGVCDLTHWNNGLDFASRIGKRAMYFIGNNTSYGEQTGTTMVQSDNEVFEPGDICGIVFNRASGKVAIYKNGELQVTMTNTGLTGDVYPVVSYRSGGGRLNSTMLTSPSQYASKYSTYIPDAYFTPGSTNTLANFVLTIKTDFALYNRIVSSLASEKSAIQSKGGVQRIIDFCGNTIDLLPPPT